MARATSAARGAVDPQAPSPGGRPYRGPVGPTRPPSSPPSGVADRTPGGPAAGTSGGPAAGTSGGPAAGTPSESARSLADDLRGRGDAELAALLAARPDLTRPLPTDLTALAARAATPTSVLRAVDGLDAGGLGVLQALAIAGDPVDEAWAARLLGLDPAGLAGPLRELWLRGLTWRGEDGHHLPRGVAEALGPYVAGLAPGGSPHDATATDRDATDRGATDRGATDRGATDQAAVARAEAAVAGLAEADRALLDQLAWEGPVGRVDDGPGDTAARVRALVADGLLHQRGAGEVILPRAVALALRGGRLHRQLLLEPPPLPCRDPGPDRVDAAAGAAAGDLLARIDELAGRWGPAPPRVLRAGGLAVADLRAAAEALQLDLPHAAFVVEIAYAAGLVDDDGELEPVWAPTALYDDWQQSPPERRWLTLAQAWLATTRAPSLVGRRRDAKAPAINALAEGAATAGGRAVRHDVLALLAAVPAGAAPEADALLGRLAWLRPRRPARFLAESAHAALAEAAWLGLTGYGALASVGRALVTGAAEEEVLLAVADGLPDAIDHVLLQADLTAVAPGRLEGRLAAFLRLAADVESRGGATVYRFTPASLRRPLDAGWDERQLLDALDGASRTGVPQPLAYLVGDVARRHGGLRVGAATAYVRSDDHVAIDDLVERRELAPYRLRRVAPGVAVAPVSPNALLAGLREAGLLPVAEGPEGAVVVPPTTHHRAPTRRGRHTTPGAAAPVPAGGLAASAVGTGGGSTGTGPYAEALAGTVAALRAGEADLRAIQARREDLTRSPLLELDPARLAAYLRDAAAGERSVWLAVVDATGAPRRLRLRPDRVEGGRVYGETDAGPGRSYSLHRIAGVGPAE